MKVSWESKGKVAVVTINNPPVNALGKDVIDQLEQAFSELEEQQDILAVVLTGAGEKAFVAGADISEFPTLKRDKAMQFGKRGQTVFQKIADFSRPVICAVNGFALGGGLELAMACDIRVVAENAKLGVPEVTLGILPGYGGTQRLPRLLGSGKAKEMIFTGEAIGAEEAYRVGIADRLVPKGAALDEAVKMADMIASRGPVAIRVAKRVIDKGLELSLAEGLNLEAEGFGELCDTEDKNEGAKAFFEKRHPNFRGV